MNKKHFAAALMAGLIGAGLFGTGAASAADAPPAGGAPVARILMVDLRRVITESKVGQDMQRQVEALNKKTEDQLKGEKASLQKEQQELQQQSAILAGAVKERRVKAFEDKVAAFQKKVRERGAMIQAGVQQAQDQIQQALGPVLQGIMRERGATIMLDRSSVLLGANGLDLTSVAIQRLDMKMTHVKVELVQPKNPLPQQ